MEYDIKEIALDYLNTGLWVEELLIKYKVPISKVVQEEIIEEVTLLIEKCKNVFELLSKEDFFYKGLIGHYFYLVRNHHGAGWFDLPIDKEIEEQLTKNCQSFGDARFYIDSNNQLGYESNYQINKQINGN